MHGALHAHAAVFDVEQAGGLCGAARFRRHDALLEPQCLGADGHRLLGDVGSFGRGSEHQDDFDRLGYVRKARVAAFAQHVVDGRVDGYDAEACTLQTGRYMKEARADIMIGQVKELNVVDGVLKSASVLGGDSVVRRVDVDQLLVFFGLSPKLGPIAEWGLSINKKQLAVDTEKFQTNIPGVFAVGDINTYPGKKKLILSGFHEAALAAFAVAAHLNPAKKIPLQYTTTSPIMHKRLGVPD